MKTIGKFWTGLLIFALICGIGGAAVWFAVPKATAVDNGGKSFSDVAEGAWYADAVSWCADNGILSGTSDTQFSPDSAMTRVMLAAVLYRAKGSPQTELNAAFSDADNNAWYGPAVSWASANGVITGYGSGAFGINDPVTREQAAAILWRYEGSPEANVRTDFSDQRNIAAFAQEAVYWAREEEIMSGKTDGRFDPKGNMTRAEAAVTLQRYLAGRDDPQGTPGSDPQQPAAPEEGPVVYMTADISPEGLMAAYDALGWTPGENTAVKLSTGEPPASNYLDPDLIKNVVQKVGGTIVECNTAYGGSRANTAMHYQVAKDHGFTDIAQVQILDENGSKALPVSGGTHLKENFVGAHFSDYDSYLVLSHFKGHAMAGFGGAIKNISIGLGSSEGKCWIHSAGRSRTNAWGGDQDDFLESMGEAGKSVTEALGGRIVYINVMNRLSVDCDCDGNPAEPDMHDIGILASADPVALDQACIDLVYSAPDGRSLINRIESRNGLHTLEYAEQIGLGNRSYRLVRLDA